MSPRAFGWLSSAGIHAALVFGGAVWIITHYGSSSPSGTGYGFGLRPDTAVFGRIERGPDRFDRKGVATDLPLSSLDGILSGDDFNDDFVGDCMKGCHCCCRYVSPRPLGMRHQDLYSRTRELRATATREKLSWNHWYRDPLPEGAGMESLRWLARHQNPDGSWGASGFSRLCKGAACSGQGDPDFDVGVTSLAVLAFLRAGFTPYSREGTRDARFEEVVRNGLKALVARQDDEGLIGARGSKPMINHTLSTLALSEASGMAPTELLRSCAQKAVDALVAAQNPGSGWRYVPSGGESDSFVTGWAVSALHAARMAELSVPRSAWEGARDWFRVASSGGSYTRVAYTPTTPDRSGDPLTLVAMSSLSRSTFHGPRRERDVAELLRDNPPVWTARRIDFCSWYVATQAMSRLHPDGDPYWSLWQEAVQKSVAANQKGPKHGCERGSWDPSADRWGTEGGRVYGVAMNLLTLDAGSGRRARYWSRFPWR